MPNIYYVKNGGTATGDAGRTTGAYRTTSFTTMGSPAYYDSLYDVAQSVPAGMTAIASGDIILCSNLHAKYYAANTTLGLLNVTVMSVDDATASTYKAGATEGFNTGELDLQIMGFIPGAYFYCKGISFISTDMITLIGTHEQIAVLTDVELILNGPSSNDYIYLSGKDGASVTFNNCRLGFGDASQRIHALGGTRLTFNNLSLTGTAINTLITSAGSGGNSITINGGDLSSLKTSIVSSITSSTSDACEYIFNRILMGSGVPIYSGTWNQKGTTIEARSVGFGTEADTFNYFETACWWGSSSEDTSTYRDAGETDASGNNFSASMVANSNVNKCNPLKHELTNFYINTSEYTTNINLKVSFCLEGTTTPLNEDDLFIKVIYADGADNALSAVASTEPALLTAGSAHSTITGEWTAAATNVQMHKTITIPIGVTKGDIASGIVTVEVYLTKNVDTNLLFVCPLVDVS